MNSTTHSVSERFSIRRRAAATSKHSSRGSVDDDGLIAQLHPSPFPAPRSPLPVPRSPFPVPQAYPGGAEASLEMSAR